MVWTHTQGPWVAVEYDDGSWGVKDGEGHAVCAIEGDENNEQNARLIENAPDLLECCIPMPDWLEELSVAYVFAGRKADAHKIMRAAAKIRAVVEAATAAILILLAICGQASAGQLVLDAVNDWPAASDELGVGKWGLYGEYTRQESFTVAHAGFLRSIDVAAWEAAPGAKVGGLVGDHARLAPEQPNPEGWTSLELSEPLAVEPGQVVTITLESQDGAFVRLSSDQALLLRAWVELLDPVEGDVTGDRRVDLADFGVLKANFGRGVGGVEVPEPSASVLAGLGLAALLILCGWTWKERRRDQR